MGEIHKYRDIKTLINNDPGLLSLDNFGMATEPEGVIEHFKAKKYEITDGGNLMGKRIQEASIIADINEKSIDWFCYRAPYLFERFLRREYFGSHQDIEATYSQTLANLYLDSEKPYPLVRFYTHLEKYKTFGVKRTEHSASYIELRLPDTPLFAAFYNSSGNLTHLRLLLYEKQGNINQRSLYAELFPDGCDFRFNLRNGTILNLSPIDRKKSRRLRNVSSGRPINLEDQQVIAYAFEDSTVLHYTLLRPRKLIHSLIFKATIPNHFNQQEVRRILLSEHNNNTWQESMRKLFPYSFAAPVIKGELANLSMH